MIPWRTSETSALYRRILVKNFTRYTVDLFAIQTCQSKRKSRTDLSILFGHPRYSPRPCNPQTYHEPPISLAFEANNVSVAECTTRYQIVRPSEIRIGVDLDWYVEVATKGVAMSIAKYHKRRTASFSNFLLLGLSPQRRHGAMLGRGGSWTLRLMSVDHVVEWMNESNVLGISIKDNPRERVEKACRRHYVLRCSPLNKGPSQKSSGEPGAVLI